MDINIAVAGSCSSKVWHNKVITWTEFVQKLRNPHRTKETVEEFKNMDSESKGKIKNCIGGFVGGRLVSDGPRNKSTLKSRRLLTLDIDYCNYDVWSKIEAMGVVSCVYSTHSHSADNIRLRVIIPLDRDVNPQEYQAISRMVASKIDIEIFDITTHEPERLMFWPSISIDGEYYFKLSEGEILKADDILNEYTFGWQDMSSWPISSRERHKINADIKKQQDPTTKDGFIGAFCRTYTITEAIAEFISDIYVPGKDETRYTYAEGSTSGGIVIYDDKFSYSHHGTDPASNMLCNAFDLIRIQKFSELDNGVRKNTKTENLPSFKKMIELCSKDKKVLVTINKDSMVAAQGEFGEVIDESSLEWLSELEHTEQGKLRSTISNFSLIIENEPMLKGKIAYNEFSNRANVTGQLPWRSKGNVQDWTDTDDSGLREFIEKYYKINSPAKCADALSLTLERHRFHPVKDYFNSLKWDGVKRVETLVIDYLGAKDNAYTRFVIKKWLVAGVARIYNPGTKFDYVPILSGPGGIGKSTFFRKLARNDWYTESLKKFDDDKSTMEVMTGKLIAEFSELSNMKKSGVDSVKAFITKIEFNARLAYERRATRHLIHWLYCGTTNDKEFLKDKTGNRRFWPVDVYEGKHNKNVFKDLDIEVDQIWAEAIKYYKEGYSIYTDKEEESLANEQQSAHMENDELEQILEDRLEWDAPKEQWKDYTYTEIITGLNLSDRLKGYARQNLKLILEKNGVYQHWRGRSRVYRIPPMILLNPISDFIE